MDRKTFRNTERHSWIRHKFEPQSNMAEMAKQKITIYLQNVMKYLKFLMRYPSFWHNKNFKPFCIYNENKKQVYNKIYTNKW